ncbi:preprotein translocase subunit SecA [Tepidibacter sp. Z1-5]|uniref:preprotein translocase subunit SecA n=1 Tax=Tepidibacter sp. Z1-5 TaxID=3134138 RepID=UPI0030BE5B14
MDFLNSFINPHEAKLKKLQKRVDKILAFEDTMTNLSDEELKLKTEEFKERLQNGQTLDNILEEAFAVVREASFRVLGMKHFPVQLIGGMVLHEGNIAQMKTGEGKTLVSTLPTYLNALTEDGVFVITANDYLASRDKEEMGRVHEFLGLSVGITRREMALPQKKDAYNCDVIYGTNSEFGFDYLRDNMVTTKENVIQRKLNYAIIDEVDSILIDEARTPLIISGQGTRPSQYYITVDKFVKSLEDDDYEVDIEKHTVNLTDAGMDKVERIFGLDTIADVRNTELLHHIRQSLNANYIMKKDQDYVVKDEQILIVDKFTGRLMPGRTFGGGLHQAIEAKEGVEVQKESRNLATVTYQNYFRMFNKISGMTGTAYTEREEFKDIYGIEVVCVPTNKPIQRIDNADLLFKTKEAKFKAIVNEVEKRYKKEQPVLIGTIYIDDSEKLSEMLDERNIKHNLLNAKQDKDEAGIISQAGQKGAITIATNMAGRGTDIKLGEGVAEVGGLFVLGTEKHDSRRIDDQLRGRSGRQGDPGESKFYASLEDSMFEKIDKVHLERVKKIVDKFNLEDDEAIEDKLVVKSIAGIQQSVENVNYNIRKNTLKFDEILNKQRETIYNERNKILNGEDMSDFIKIIIQEVADKIVDIHTSNSPYPEEWDLVSFQEDLNEKLYFDNKINLKDLSLDEIENLDKEELKEQVRNEALEIYRQKEENIETEQLRYIERLTLMKTIDQKWVDYLDIVEQIRQGIGFHHVGKADPVRVFNDEAFRLFDDMLSEVKELTIKSLFVLGGFNFKEAAEKAEEEKDKAEKVLELEDKYKLNREHLPKIPKNTPKLAFNVDINANEEIKVQTDLYYMEEGYEKKLEGYENELTVKGAFKVEFNKQNDKDWDLGWYQIKVLVLGQEASVINFLIVEQENTPNTNIQDVRFFSEKLESINFDFKLANFDKNTVKVNLRHKQNDLGTFDAPVQDGNVKINIKRPSDGWIKDLYSLIVLTDKNNIIIPFVIGEEFRENENISISFSLNIPEGAEVVLNGKITCLNEEEIVANVPIKINRSGNFNVNFDRNDMSWKQGMYKFELLSSNEVILVKHFLVK